MSHPNARLEALSDGVFAIAMTVLILGVAAVAFWLPLAAAAVTTLTWIFWLAFGLRQKHV